METLGLDKTDLANHLATPLIIFDDQTPEEMMIAADQMVQRSFALQAFIQGQLNWDDYLMLLDDHGIDAIHAHDDWVNGVTYL
ncbi:MAG: hypothetical protein AAF959_09890 [Cyanobacteria bacterium P01_D01_bin.56]